MFAAKNEAKVFYRPYGYSAFLRWVHGFSQSDTALVTVQFLLTSFDSLFLYFTVDYLLGFGSKGIRILVLLLFSPLVLVVCNVVSSDGLFASLTVLWFALLLWIILRRPWWAVVVQLVLLYCLFLIRYNAIYFPVVAALAFVFAYGASLPYRIVGVASSILVVMSGYISVKKETYEATGANVFSGFSGWQSANNALFMYKHIKVDSRIFDEPELRVLDTIVKTYIDSVSAETLQKIEEGKLASSIFMWDSKSPLKVYTAYYCNKNRLSYYPAWRQVSELFSEYSKELILQYPMAYFRYFMWNNMVYFFVPDK
ncbi:MAG: hypothetical protein QM642_03860 [Edaphocola sp.]